MKKIILFFAFCSFAFIAEAQNKFKYSVNLNVGVSVNLAKSGFEGNEDKFNVHYLRPWVKKFSGSFNLFLKHNWYVGVGFNYDEYDYGYVAEATTNYTPGGGGIGLSSGLLAADDRLSTYGVMLSLGKEFQKGKFLIDGSFGLSLEYYQYSDRMNDTAQQNYSEWKFNYGTSKLLYIVNPPEQHEGIFPFLMGNVKVSYPINKHRNLYLGLIASYKQGFSTIIKDYVVIMDTHDINNIIQQKNYTNNTGTNASISLGLTYKFK